MPLRSKVALHSSTNNLIYLTSVLLILNAQGEHNLTLQFANALHESYGPEYAKTITVNVK